MINKVFVDLKERSYDILIAENALRNLPEFLAKKKYSKIFVVSDENVASLYLPYLKEVLPGFELIKVKAGESAKSFSVLENVAEEILEKGIDRKSLLIAFGGGVVGDLTGFLASILLRGIDFVQVPTTLLSMVDSSVGGKTAINSKAGKNLVGTFYQPKLVICDLRFLLSLPTREIRAGYAEVVKYGLIFDEKFFEFLEKNFAEIFNFNMEILQKIVKRSCEIKAEIVASDEKENGLRALLNFGHTFGHVFETETNYSNEILHGEAVALGMTMACDMSQNLEMLSKEDALRVKKHFLNVGFVTEAKKIRINWNKENLVKHLFKDKKVDSGKLTFILLNGVGKAVIVRDVEIGEFEKALNS